MERTKRQKISTQMKRSSAAAVQKDAAYKGNTETMVSTGSTLLDLAISGKRKRGGGIPGGILMEIFGPNGAGKTVLLSEIAGAIQRQGGDIKFNDPEARINKQFASMFDFEITDDMIDEPDTVTEMIQGVKTWEPKGSGKINGIMTDSLAALSTNMEMDKEEGDKMGMRRAKEFSEGLRKVCRILKNKNFIMACSNQIRTNAETTGYGEKFTTPGGVAVGFYSSVRLRVHKPEKITLKKTVHGKEVPKVIGIKAKIEVYKNSVDAPYRTAPVYILFDYGIDDIRANLQYMKDYTSRKAYGFDAYELGAAMDKAIAKVEDLGLEKKLRNAVINLWHEIEEKFKVERKRKKR